ncbi:hypothetical protein DEU56DRAFT_798081 [Suillus clintonianus]|uniref:uncharacterized protein n=1 Tax=Suillus clintonianus TaxID=1904413 RepID=UPI001B86FB82|nr:uncharacterized protein DEU56DRAFT_798081 [Suillus clintonianus]KAG2140667.1 hypothetical protein DEU56DRAFT_798081 [Suillus clintonianus]
MKTPSWTFSWTIDLIASVCAVHNSLHRCHMYSIYCDYGTNDTVCRTDICTGVECKAGTGFLILNIQDDEYTLNSCFSSAPVIRWLGTANDESNCPLTASHNRILGRCKRARKQ